MTRSWARVLRKKIIVIAMVFSPAACLIPPDGTLVPEVRNHPPEIELSSIRPQKPLSEVSDPRNYSDCPSIRLEAEVFDPDGDPLRVRFVSDNHIDNLVSSISETIYPATSTPYTVFDFLLPGVSIRGLEAQDTHVISMFVTDAPEFLVPNEETSNYAEIESDPNGDGVDDYHLIEHRWTFRFVDSGDLCPR